MVTASVKWLWTHFLLFPSSDSSNSCILTLPPLGPTTKYSNVSRWWWCVPEEMLPSIICQKYCRGHLFPWKHLSIFAWAAGWLPKSFKYSPTVETPLLLKEDLAHKYKKKSPTNPKMLPTNPKKSPTNTKNHWEIQKIKCSATVEDPLLLSEDLRWCTETAHLICF